MTGPLSRLDGGQYGDPDDYRPAHVAPRCERCQTREAVDALDGTPLCQECLLHAIEDEQEVDQS